MAERQTSDDGKGQPQASSSEDDVMETCKKSIESVKQTLSKFDDLDKRWQEAQQKFADTLRVSLQTMFGLQPPDSLTLDQKLAVLEGKPDIDEICKRLKHGQFKHIVVLTGAGISVSAGIPDFRSPGTGFYDKLDITKYNLPSPQSVFELDYFKQNPKPFFCVAKELFPGKYRPTPTHYFIKLLANKELLLRCYTQNIDGLEKVAGIKEDHLVEAHGSFSTAKCTVCAKRQSADKVKAVIIADEIPTCDACKGVVKPDIVFFGEDLPRRYKDLVNEDLLKCDLLIVMGTSLQVQSFARLIHVVDQTIPRLLINRERVGNFVLGSEGGYRDVAMIMDCDTAVAKICEMSGWSEDLNSLTQPEVHKTKAKTEPLRKAEPSSTRLKRTNQTGHANVKKK